MLVYYRMSVEKVFSSFQLNVNSYLRLKFIQNLKDNKPFENITDLRLKNISQIFPFFISKYKIYLF